jgi:hypothetical protein
MDLNINISILSSFRPADVTVATMLSTRGTDSAGLLLITLWH